MSTSRTSAPSSDPLRDLPDRPALDQLSRALWSRGTMRGAAVLVGAGVSRGGAKLVSNDAPLPPLWSDLAAEMANELYGTQKAAAPMDPLRLAEEFRVGLGDAALTDFLRRRIRDDALEPGPIHRDLLDLPWGDVLTTNYDTLIERAAKDARRNYDIVLTEKDLPHACGPRVIKLHGSLHDGAGVIISEEDYRSYPQKRAAFVNTARQVFIENELCLLGFSGDDPNFLQWAGWVRDRLSSHARRIYLVGALDLPPIKRRLLEARGIAPIDLAPAVQSERADRRHAAAISLFLAHLKATRPAEPDDWEPAPYQDYPSLHGGDHEAWFRDFRNPEKVVEAFRAALAIWRNDRQMCPDWLICPPKIRNSFRRNIHSVANLPLALDTLPMQERQKALLELAWLHDRGIEPLAPWLAERMNAMLTSEGLAEADPDLLRALVRVLLGAARLAGDEAMVASCVTRFEPLTTPGDLSAIVAYERCLFARDRLDFAFVAENASRVEGDDPVWGVRRAALLYWTGEQEEAHRTVGMSARDLRARVLRDPDSVALRSRLAWIRTLAEALRWEDRSGLLAELDGLDRLALRDYDPWGQLQALDADVAEGLRKRWESRPIDPGFEAGTYRDNANTVIFSENTHVMPLLELRHVAERAGLPIRTRYVNVLGTSLADALRLAFEPTAAWHTAFLSTKPNDSKGAIEIHLGRIPVARLDESVVAETRDRLEHAIAFWRARVRKEDNNHEDVEMLRLYVEALSRVTARDDTETAKQHVRLAVALGEDEALRHWWMDESIGHLLKRAINAVPPKERTELSPELLRFPLAAERSVIGPAMHWYDPGPSAYRFVRRSGNETLFDARVATFLSHLAGDGPSRAEAAVRLLCLHEKEQLTDDQVSLFANALWKGVPKDGNELPTSLNLLSHAFLIAPSPPDIDVRARVYAHLFVSGEGVAPIHLVKAAEGLTPYVQPNEADAAKLFDKIVCWRPRKLDSSSIDDVFSRPVQEAGDRMTASTLGVVAAPALMKGDRTIVRAEAALAFLDETDLPEALLALPVFYGLSADIDRRVESAFRRCLSVGDRRVTPAAVDALDHWLNLSSRERALPLPRAIYDRVLLALERGRIGGLAHLVYLARRMTDAGLWGVVELDRIAEVLDELQGATDYGPSAGDADIESDRAVFLPLIRAECVRLARALEGKGVTTEPVCAWRDLAVHDPLPEVRYAISEMAGE